MANRVDLGANRVDGANRDNREDSEVNKVDLAVSKIARFQDQDRADIAALARHGLLDGAAFQTRVEEALDHYVGDARWVRYNLRDARALIDASAPVPDRPRGPAP